MSSKRVWIYCRTAHPDANFLEAQEQYMIGYAKEQGFSIVGITSEHGSGLDFSRKGLKAVSNAIETRKADAILVKDVSRLGRDPEEVDVYLSWLKKHNAEMLCADGTTPMLYADLRHSLMEMYLAEIAG